MEISRMRRASLSPCPLASAVAVVLHDCMPCLIANKLVPTHTEVFSST